MRVYCVQPDLAWHDAAANRAACGRMIDAAEPDAGSILALPETFASGYTTDVAAADDGPDGLTAAWVAQTARATQCWVIAGLVTRDADGRGLNQAVVCSPAGAEIGRYTKRHLLPVGGEAEHYAAGPPTPFSFDAAGVRVAVRICYDLRFPETFRDDAGADLFVVIANWPAARSGHWLSLLQARAIENQAFVAGVNRVGSDPNGRYAGDSRVFDFAGRALRELIDEPAVGAASLDLDALRQYRRKLPFLADFLRGRR